MQSRAWFSRCEREILRVLVVCLCSERVCVSLSSTGHTAAASRGSSCQSVWTCVWTWKLISLVRPGHIEPSDGQSNCWLSCQFDACTLRTACSLIETFSVSASKHPTSRSWAVFENLLVVQLLNFTTFYGARSFIIVLTKGKTEKSAQWNWKTAR
jgi:hypothetical protein